MPRRPRVRVTQSLCLQKPLSEFPSIDHERVGPVLQPKQFVVCDRPIHPLNTSALGAYRQRSRKHRTARRTRPRTRTSISPSMCHPNSPRHTATLMVRVHDVQSHTLSSFDSPWTSHSTCAPTTPLPPIPLVVVSLNIQPSPTSPLFTSTHTPQKYPSSLSPLLPPTTTQTTSSSTTLPSLSPRETGTYSDGPSCTRIREGTSPTLPLFLAHHLLASPSSPPLFILLFRSSSPTHTHSHSQIHLVQTQISPSITTPFPTAPGAGSLPPG